MKNRKIKVCFVSTFAYGLFNSNTKLTFGGAEVQMSLLAKELSKDKNFDVHFIVGHDDQDGYQYFDSIKLWKSFSLKKKLFNYLVGPFKLYLTLKKINPDIVIQRTACIETTICALFCKLNRKNFIYSVSHDNEVNKFHLKKSFKGIIFLCGFNKADKIIFQNILQANMFKRFWKGRSSKTIIVLSGYPIIKDNSVKKDYILWVSRSESWKNPHLFLSLAKKFPNEKFVMIMPKNPDKDLWKIIYNKSKIIKNIKFIESVPFDQIQKYFNEAKIFVNTSKYEGFPNTFIQSCLGKTPIVSLNVNPNGFLDKYDCGIFCKGNFRLLNENLNLLLNNKRLYRFTQKNLINYIDKNHNIFEIVNFWKDIFYNTLYCSGV